MEDRAAHLWGHDTTQNLAAVLKVLPAVDALVITGDLAEDGAPAAYQRLRELTSALTANLFFLPGNHDDTTAMQATLGSTTEVEMARVSERWTLALLNSQWVGHDAGRIGDDRLARLRDALDRVDGHVVLCLHHPPLSPCPAADCGLSDGDRLRQVIDEARNVRVVLSGHVHRAFDATRQRTRYLGAPSTFRQLSHGGEPHYTETGEPPAARLVELLDDGEIRTQVIRAAHPDPMTTRD